MKNNTKKEITLKLNKREVQVIKNALYRESFNIQGNINSSYTQMSGSYRESAINELYNLESVQNKIKKEGL